MVFVVNEKGLLRKVILPFGVLWQLLLVIELGPERREGSKAPRYRRGANLSPYKS